MGTEQFLTHEDKLESLTALRARIIEDISRLVAEIGIDEDSFNIAEYGPPEKKLDRVKLVMELTLYRHCQSVLSIDIKIEELTNVQ
jgi:hypothetical protein